MTQRAAVLRALATQFSSIVVIALVTAGGTSVGSLVRLDSARQSFDGAMPRLIHEVEADDDAHASLTSAQNSSFSDSVSTLTTLLSTCVGADTMTQTTTDLKELAGFQSEPTARRVLLPLIDPPDTVAGYAKATAQIDRLVASGRLRTAETNAVTESNLIATDEVNLDLDAAAESILGQDTAVEAKYAYATTDTQTIYQSDAEHVVEELTTISPSLTSNRLVKVTPTQSTALIKSLTAFGNACASLRTSSIANTPPPPPPIIHRHAIDLWPGPLTMIPIWLVIPPFVPAPAW